MALGLLTRALVSLAAWLAMTFFCASLYAATAGDCNVKKKDGINSGLPSPCKAARKVFISMYALVGVLHDITL